VRASKHIRETIDTLEGEDGLYYDLISFDPRGVGETKPAVTCVANQQLAHSWQVRVMEEGVFESSDAAMGRLWSMSVAMGQSCSLPLESTAQGTPADMRQFVTTASVARDMLEIVERHGEWREKEVERILREEKVEGKACVPFYTRCHTSLPTAAVYLQPWSPADHRSDRIRNPQDATTAQA